MTKLGGPKTGLERRRLASLDGLRGLAAAVVVLSHLFLATPELAAALTAEPPPAHTWWGWLLTRTPLHLCWAGPEAVKVFFVLSGYVLWVQMSRAERRQWMAYYPRRLLRLYLPVMGAVMVAVLLLAAFPRQEAPGFSWWMQAHAGEVSIRDALMNLTLAETGWLNSPLWSLKLEVLFSLLLPIYGVLLRLRWVSPWGLALAALGAFALGRAMTGSTLIFLPVFALGMLLAEHRASLTLLTQRWGVKAWGTMMVASLLFLNVEWTPWTVGSKALEPLSVLGATLLVALFVHCPVAKRFGELRVAQWLGLISFSVYLIHDPIIVSVAFSLHTTNVFAIGSAALPLMIVMSIMFHRCIELPSLQVSRQIGRWVLSLPGPSVQRRSPAWSK